MHDLRRLPGHHQGRRRPRLRRHLRPARLSTATVEPSMARYAVLDLRRDQPHQREETLVEAESPASSTVDLVPVGVEREGDGILKIGSTSAPPRPAASPSSAPRSSRASSSRSTRSTKPVASSSVPVEYSQGDSGDTSTDTATVTATRLIGEGVDAMVGPAAPAWPSPSSTRSRPPASRCSAPANDQPCAVDLRRQGSVLP